MRDAAKRGDLQAQLAVGRFYLMGLEEMGADPAEAEKWLSIAAGRGNAEAKNLLAQASAAKQNEQTLYQWRERHRTAWYGWWASGYAYYGYWGPNGWYYR
jgi:TPR repeat protein